jgi:hypothetical protein
LPRGQHRAGQRQNVMAQPLNECPNIASQAMSLCFALPRQRQLTGKVVVRTPLPGGALDLHLQRLTPRCHTLCEL